MKKSEIRSMIKEEILKLNEERKYTVKTGKLDTLTAFPEDKIYKNKEQVIKDFDNNKTFISNYGHKVTKKELQSILKKTGTKTLNIKWSNGTTITTFKVDLY